MAETMDRDDAQALIDAARLAASRDVAAAAHLLTRSLEFLAADDPLRKEVVLELIPLAMWGGRPRQAERLARTELASADNERETTLRMHLAEAIGMQDRWSEAATMWAELNDAAAVPHPVRLRARAERASALAFCRDIGRARAMAQEVLDESKNAPDESCRFLALQSLGACLFFEGRCEEAVSIAEELVAIADASDDVRLLWRNPRLFYGVALTAAGQLAQANTVLHAGRELARRTGALWAMPAYQCYIALLSYREGRWKDAVAECEEGLRICEASEATMELATLLGIYAVIEARRAAFQNVDKLIERFDGMETTTHGDRAWRALAVALAAEGRGDRPRAYQELAGVWQEANDLGVSLTLMNVTPDLLRLAMDAGDNALGAGIVEHFASLEERNPGSPLIAALVSHSRGVVFEDPDNLEAAIIFYRTAGHLPHETLAWEELAIIRAEDGRSKEALSALREALNRFDAMGALGDGRRTRARLRWRNIVAPPPAVDTVGDGKWAALTKTEKVVAELVAEGLRNQEIAERLFVSIQTVQTHLKNIFKKFGATSRSQVVREVLSHRDELEDAFGSN